jgi:hypothetical protein
LKVLLHHLVPFAWLPNGPRTRILQTEQALKQSGVDAEFLRWYDGSQTGDILHFFGRISSGLSDLARENGMKVVLTDWREAKGGPPRWLGESLNLILPPTVSVYLGWDVYKQADACVAFTPEDARMMIRQYGAPPARTRVIPAPDENGGSTPASRAWLDVARELTSLYQECMRPTNAKGARA